MNLKTRIATLPKTHLENPFPKEISIRERCHIRELMNDASLPDASIARARVEPGVTTELHCLDVQERYIIEQGQGLMEIGGQKNLRVTPGDIINIARGTPQRITNTGAEDLIFLCLCCPRFTPDCYKPLEETS